MILITVIGDYIDENDHIEVGNLIQFPSLLTNKELKWTLNIDSLARFRNF